MEDAFTMVENLTEELGTKEDTIIEHEKEIAVLKKQLHETKEERNCLLKFNNVLSDLRNNVMDFAVPEEYLLLRGSVIIITKQELYEHCKWCIRNPNMNTGLHGVHLEVGVYEPSEEEWEEITQEYLGEAYGPGTRINEEEDKYCYDFTYFTTLLVEFGMVINPEWDEDEEDEGEWCFGNDFASHPFLEWCLPAFIPKFIRDRYHIHSEPHLVRK